MTRLKKEVEKMSDAREQMLALLEKDEAIKELLQVTIQGVLEAEMEEALGAGAGVSARAAGGATAAATIRAIW